jgi:hypothetical protein
MYLRVSAEFYCDVCGVKIEVAGAYLKHPETGCMFSGQLLNAPLIHASRASTDSRPRIEATHE